MRAILVLLGAVMLAGCNFLPKPADVHDFGLDARPHPVNKTSDLQPDAIRVEAPKWLYDNRIRYRLLHVAPTQVKFYTLDRWLAPPPELFAELLLASDLDLSESLIVYLLEFEQQFNNANQAKVVMRFKVKIPKNGLHPEKQKEFLLEKNCPSANAKGAISAFSELTHNAAQNIVIWLKRP